jgi:lysine-N-methylase
MRIEKFTYRFQEVYQNYFKRFIEQHEFIFENYLVNYVFKDLFPLGNESLYDNYVRMVINYSLIKLILIGMSGHHKGLNKELAIKLIQSFGKTIEHNNIFLNSISKSLNKQGFTTSANISILINI